MSPWKLTTRGFKDLFWAMLIGGVIAVPFEVGLLADLPSFQYVNIVLYRFDQMPADDHTLLDWYRQHPAIAQVSTRRVGAELEVEYHQRPFSRAVGFPPFEELGYKGFKGFHGPPGGVTSGISMTEMTTAIMKNPAILMVLVLCAQVGFLIIAVRRLRAAKKAGETIPLLLAGDRKQAILAGIAAGIAMLAFGWLYSVVMKALLGPTATVSVFDALSSFALPAQILILLVGGVAGPMCEELFFRGTMFGSFVGAGHIRFGAIVSALAFAVAHLNPNGAIFYIVFGLVTAWLYRRTGSILAPMTTHVLNNIVVFLLVFTGRT